MIPEAGNSLRDKFFGDPKNHQKFTLLGTVKLFFNIFGKNEILDKYASEMIKNGFGNIFEVLNIVSMHI